MALRPLFDIHYDESQPTPFKRKSRIPYFKEKFEALETSENLTPVELAKEIKLLLVENAKVSRLREKKIIRENGKKSEPWFDSECRRDKNNVNRLGNLIQKKPTDSTLRMQLRDARKSFKRTILAKKRNYKHKMLDLLESKKETGTQKEFWDIFRKNSPKSKKGARSTINEKVLRTLSGLIQNKESTNYSSH